MANVDSVKRGGIHHLGLAVKDYDATLHFYTQVMGFEIAYQVKIDATDGSEIMTHVMFDTGDGTMIAFMIPGPETPLATSDRWTTDISSGLGVRGPFYHFAFAVGDLEELEQKQAELRSRGIDVTEVDYKGVWGSIYFRDPNGLMLEYCFTNEPLTEDRKLRKTRDDHSLAYSDADLKIMTAPPAPFDLLASTGTKP